MSLVIHSAAVPATNVELQEARRRQLTRAAPRILTTAEAISYLFRDHFVVAVAGTHGKSTTTAMIALALVRAGWNPAVVVGTRMQEFGNSNFRAGGPFSNRLGEVARAVTGGRPVLVVEACEYAGAFLHYRPDIAVVTNVEPDHLDYYGDFGTMAGAFRNFLATAQGQGTVVANSDDLGVLGLLSEGTVEFSLQEPAAGLVRSNLTVAGDHNVLNGLAALKVARLLAIPDDVTLSALSGFKGTWRRLQVYDLKSPVHFTLVDDYAHHPTALRATLQAVRERWPGERLILVYQPHQASRTADLFEAFVAALEWAPACTAIIAETYEPAGRDLRPIGPEASSRALVEELRRRGQAHAEILFMKTVESIETYLAGSIIEGDVVVVMGAGDIYALTCALSCQPDPFLHPASAS